VCSRLVVAALGLVVAVAGPASAQVFRAGVDMVSLGVTVVDRAGDLVGGLAPEDFAVFEDGVRQDVQLFVDGTTADGDRPPLHIGLLFDTSGSMVDDLAMARTAAIRFCNVLSRAEDITLVVAGADIPIPQFAYFPSWGFPPCRVTRRIELPV